MITGASRGIGLAIAIKLGSLGANVAIAAKTAVFNPKLAGTIYTAAKEIEQAGGRALPIVCDIRFQDQIESAIAKTVSTFGGIDILVNNASAIDLTPMADASIKKFDLMFAVNGRGTWLTTKLALPHLLRSSELQRNPQIMMLSPPLDMRRHWFSPHVGYTMAKYNMSLIVHGLAGELEGKIGVNALWPLNGVDTAAVSNVLTDGSKTSMRTTMKVEIMSDAAFAILSQDGTKFTGNFCIDRTVLQKQGIQSFEYYKTDPSCRDADLMPDFFVPERIGDCPVQDMRIVLDASSVRKTNSFGKAKL